MTGVTGATNNDTMLGELQSIQHGLLYGSGQEDSIDLYSAAVKLNAIYRLDLWKLYALLQKTYQPSRAFPRSHWGSICEQIEGVER